MRALTFILLQCLLIMNALLWGQIQYTAQDSVIPYAGHFSYGSNSGWFPPHTNQQISGIVASAGCHGIRGTIPHDFITTWGLNADMPYWTNNTNIGLKENVAFIGFPHSSVEDPHLHCGGIGCSVHGTSHKPGNFRGLYLPIWDAGANGTPVNDSNTYAKYVYDIVTTYKNHVRFWEIWNEPDFSTSANAWAPPSNPNSWWNRSNFECECPCMSGTIFNYVRMLRVSYEVIKSVDSTAYVCTGGIGWASFLDAILRYTDNPVDGSVTPAYPHTGGAWFDVLSYHRYAQFSPTVRYWDNTLGQMVDARHSDAAADGVRQKQQEMNNVLSARGYNGSLYPEKEWIITQHNISRRPFGTYIGGEEAQRNYHMKTLALQQLDGIKQSYVYGASERTTVQGAWGSFDLMGLYESVANRSLNQPLTSAGVVNLTMSQILHTTRVDHAETQSLNLPINVRGAAFVDSAGDHVYVLWVETQTDNSEQASGSYSFPAQVVTGTLTKYEWNYSQTNQTSSISPLNVALTGTPILLKEQSVLPAVLVGFSATHIDEKVELKWQTRRESNLSHFTLKRSENGSSFEEVAKVFAKNGATFSNYVEFDFQPSRRTSRYQLLATDMNGATSLLKTVTVQGEERAISLNWSKVANAQAWEFEITLPEMQTGNLTIFAADGRTVNLFELPAQDQTHRIKVDVSGLASGLYVVVLEGNGERIVKKLQR